MTQITNKTKLSKYLILRLLSDCDESVFESMPLKFNYKRFELPSSTWDISYEQFCSAVKYSQELTYSPTFLECITNVNKNIWENSKVVVSLPLYLHYKSELDEILEAIRKVSEEAPKPTKPMARDMQEFGLANIAYMLQPDITKHDIIYFLPVHKIYEAYKYEIYTRLNQISESKN